MNQSSVKPEREYGVDNRENMKREISNEALTTLESNIAKLENEHEKVRKDLP